MTAPVFTRPAHYLRGFAKELADRLNVDPTDVAGAIMDLALADLIELSVSPQGIILRANPLTEEAAVASKTDRRVSTGAS